MEESGPKKVLHIVSAMDRGGAETLIMNVYRNIDRRSLQFDFVVHRADQGHYDDEITELGGTIYRVNSLGSIGPIKYVNELEQIMKSYPYIAVHSHTDYQGGFSALAAKRAGIKKRICHSHSNNWLKGSNFKGKAAFILLKQLIKNYATDYCSCSKEAALFLFGKQNSRHTKILKNGIDLSLFTYGKQERESLLKELKLPEDAIMIGHVGKFSQSKNQLFVLKILKKLISENNRFTVLFVGDGPLKQEVKKEAEKLGVLQNTRFLGVREDIPRLMKAFDVFLFPSIFEGFGIVTIEAQSVGTPCILSDMVPKSTDMGLGLTNYISLNSNLELWCSEINRALQMDRPDQNKISQQISAKGYNITTNVNDWINLYEINAI